MEGHSQNDIHIARRYTLLFMFTVSTKIKFKDPFFYIVFIFQPH